jgi:hypothetical protein
MSITFGAVALGKGTTPGRKHGTGKEFIDIQL